MKEDKYFLITNLGSYGEFTNFASNLYAFDDEPAVQEYLKKRESVRNIRDFTIIKGQKLTPNDRFYFKNEKEAITVV